MSQTSSQTALRSNPTTRTAAEQHHRSDRAQRWRGGGEAEPVCQAVMHSLVFVIV